MTFSASLQTFERDRMTFRRRQLLRLAAGAAALAAVPRIATGETYPARPVRVIVPFAPGGPTDVFARLMAQKLSEQMGVQFYVENIAGAGGNIGAGRATGGTTRPRDGAAYRHPARRSCICRDEL